MIMYWLYQSFIASEDFPRSFKITKPNGEPKSDKPLSLPTLISGADTELQGCNLLLSSTTDEPIDGPGEGLSVPSVITGCLSSG